jgi:hypothetical protein
MIYLLHTLIMQVHPDSGSTVTLMVATQSYDSNHSNI